MNVLIVSQCNKSALVESRRILDQFAERRGDRTWQTAITQQGLDTLRKMLRKNAKRNTAVACHWIKSSNRTELLWIVGNIRRFNEQGAVPTNTTEQDILRNTDESQWHTAEDILLLSGIAGLFHDFGKANFIFQEKLKGNDQLYEAYRHEWVSLKIFKAFVGDAKNDLEWLQKLTNLKIDDEDLILKNIKEESEGNIFANLPPLAKSIGWLIVTHHYLPRGEEPRWDKIDSWLNGSRFNDAWKRPDIKQKGINKKLWSFPDGTPLRSKTWLAKAQALGSRALVRRNLFKCWLTQDRFTTHIARMVLMFADHSYSAADSRKEWQDDTCGAFANTDKNNNLKQKLDEHNIGVSENAVRMSRFLPKMRLDLPSITRCKDFKKRTENEKFRWQDKAYDLACTLKQRSVSHGFFGINLSSTGCGKTLANARIMYGLSNEKIGCRFSIALGLRNLTLQTGDALRERLCINEEDMAVLIGSQAIKELHEFHKNENKNLDKGSGSESVRELFSEHQYIRYEGTLYDGHFKRWLEKSNKLHKLVSAPVLVSTIDHLIPATEGERGGKQIAPMLRLLTADLVLDEPDEFDLKDLPALTRLVNWAGMLGSRVLLSSATLPPALIEALFDAYRAGRKIYQEAVGEPNVPLNICCAWFDEYGVHQSDHQNLNSFTEAHKVFVSERVNRLRKLQPLRLARLLSIKPTSNKPGDVMEAISQGIFSEFINLHNLHHQQHPQSKKRISIGLVRMANINPLVALAKKLFSIKPESNFRIHYCVYHSQHPLIVRSVMESHLDKLLKRHNPNQIWKEKIMIEALENYPEDNHLFIVLSSPVAEVGRDHDYDWAIAEPSSMRSLVQLAGRIQRHRYFYPKEANLLILNKNYPALRGDKIAYYRPGFESDKANFLLKDHDLNQILTPEQLQNINAISRIQEREVLDGTSNFVDLEHQHTRAKLFGENSLYKEYAARWWQHPIDWCAEMQKNTPFREGQEEDCYILYFEEEGDIPKFNLLNDDVLILKDKELFVRDKLLKEQPISTWGYEPYEESILQQAEFNEMSILEACRKFGEIRLRPSEKKWCYHPSLGIYNDL